MNSLEKARVRNVHIYQLLSLLVRAGFDINNVKPATHSYNWCIFVHNHICSTVMRKNNKIVFGFTHNSFHTRPNLRPLRKLFPAHRLKTVSRAVDGEGSGFIFSLEAVFKDTETVQSILDTLGALSHLKLTS